MTSAVIKAGDIRMATRGMYSLELRDIAEKADVVLSEAKTEAARIIEDAHQRAESEQDIIRHAAFRKSYEEGFAEGAEAGRKAALEDAKQRFTSEHATLAPALKNAADTMNAQREKLYLAARRDVIVLAISIARRITSKLACVEDAANDAATQACGEALELLSGANEVVIRTHPADKRAMDALTESLSKTLQSSRHLRVVEDPAVGRGGAIVESADCAIDARADERVERIADELVADWRKRLKILALKR